MISRPQRLEPCQASCRVCAHFTSQSMKLVQRQTLGVQGELMARRSAARAVRCSAARGLWVLAVAVGCSKLPDLAVEHLKQGDEALADGRYAQALSAYSHAHELAPNDPTVQRAQMRARVYLMADNPGR